MVMMIYMYMTAVLLCESPLHNPNAQVFDLDEEPLPAERWDETLGCHVSCMRIDRPHHQVKLPQALVAASPRDNPSLAPLAPHAFAHADELAGPEHRFAPGLEMDME